MSVKQKAPRDVEVAAGLGIDLPAAVGELEKLDAAGRVAWALERFRPDIALTSSFGAQAAVSLHLVTRLWPEIPVILIDTGYLFPETYTFIDELADRLDLNLQVTRPHLSPAWLENRHGKLWEQGLEGIEQYNQIAKVEPMARALEQSGARAWLAGLRRQQSRSRGDLPIATTQNGRLKVHPIIDWTDREVFEYMKANDLPYHPLWSEGYVSIGDHHTSHKLTDGMDEEDARFFGLKRECGIHEDTDFVI